MNSLSRLLENRLWKRKRAAALEMRRKQATTQREHQSSSPHSATKSNKTDPTYDQSILSDMSLSPSKSPDVLTPESLRQGHFRQQQGIYSQQQQQNLRSNHQLNPGSEQTISPSRSTSKVEFQKASTSNLSRIVEDSVVIDAHHIRERDNVSNQLKDTILGHAPIRQLFQQGNDTSYNDQSLDELRFPSSVRLDNAARFTTTNRSEAAYTHCPSTQASTHVATNRAIDLALRRIEQMQVQLQREHDRLDALVENEAVTAVARRKLRRRQQHHVDEPYHLKHGKEYLDATSVDSNDDVVSSQGQKQYFNQQEQSATRLHVLPEGHAVSISATKSVGRLGQHVQRMQAKFLSSDDNSNEPSRSISSVGVEIALDQPLSSEAVKQRFHQAQAGYDGNPFRNSLSLPALSSQMPTRNVNFAKPGIASDMLSPPQIQRYVFRPPGVTTTSMASSNVTPDPVFCPSPATLDVLTPPPRYATMKDDLPKGMLSPDSIFASTFNSSFQSSVDASDCATFMHGSAMAEVANDETSKNRFSLPSQLFNNASSLPVSGSLASRSNQNQSTDAKSRPTPAQIYLAALAEKQSTKAKVLEKSNLLAAQHLQPKIAQADCVDSEKHIDVQSIKTALENKQAAAGLVEEKNEGDDDVSVKSLREIYDAQPCPKPSVVRLMRAKFDQKPKAAEPCRQFQQTVLKFGSVAVKRPATKVAKEISVEMKVIASDEKQSAGEAGSATEMEQISDIPFSIKDRIQTFEISARDPSVGTPRNTKSRGKLGDQISAVMARSWTDDPSGFSNETTKSSAQTWLGAVGLADKNAGKATRPSLPQRSGIEVYRDSVAKSFAKTGWDNKEKDILATHNLQKNAPITVVGYRQARRPVGSQSLRALDLTADAQNVHKQLLHAKALHDESIAATSFINLQKLSRVETQSANTKSAARLICDGGSMHDTAASKSLESEQREANPKAIGDECTGYETNNCAGDCSRLQRNKGILVDTQPEVHEGISMMIAKNSDAPCIVRPTPMKQVPVSAMSTTEIHSAVIVPSFRPVSAAISDTSLSRYSNSSLTMIASLLKFSNKARMAAKHDTSPPARLWRSAKGTTRCADTRVDDAQNSAKPIITRAVPRAMAATFLVSKQADDHHSYNCEQKRPKCSPDFANEEKKDDGIDGSRSFDGSSDGVTLDLSIADVSILTTPTALISKAEENQGYVDDSSKTSSSAYVSDRGGDESSSQLSEAAIPLLARDNRDHVLLDEYSGSAHGFFVRSANKTSGWDAAPTTQNLDWDIFRMESLFPKSSDGLPKKKDIFDIDSDASTFAGAQSDGQSKTTERSRAITPTRSNRSVRLVPTTRRYSKKTLSSHLHNANVEARDDRQASGRGMVQEPAMTLTSHPTNGMYKKQSSSSGFPLSRTLREQAVRTSKLNSTLIDVSLNYHSCDRAITRPNSLSRFSDEHSKLMIRLRRLREARILRERTSYPTVYEAKTFGLNNWDMDDASKSTQSSTNFGGVAFNASLDLD
ncbi:hypothetical protein MPSEU_001000700 [Mayamaea pseudoterrestris]|nr:hypothetical protein MPSEU_001000700 [Mayamaea pseudoterrestris]